MDGSVNVTLAAARTSSNRATETRSTGSQQVEETTAATRLAFRLRTCLIEQALRRSALMLPEPNQGESFVIRTAFGVLLTKTSRRVTLLAGIAVEAGTPSTHKKSPLRS